MFVIFTDVDGTLIDHTTYSIGAASRALARLEERGVPLVLSSSKTRAEVERLQQDLGTAHPFVTENGGAVFVPHGYFTFLLPGALRRPSYDVVELGRPYEAVVNALRRASASSGVGVAGFNDLSVEEIAADAGLSLAAARLAKLREYDEPFRLLPGREAGLPALALAMASEGLRCTSGGRYHHACGPTDKGVPVRLLTPLLRSAYEEVVTVALGDGPNDVPMLLAADIPIIVSNPTSGATPEGLRRVPGARVTARPGPDGWQEAIAELVP
jgi:mannosyl-3-phosphoglycerate phosphatase